MPYCPECGAEYRKGFEECTDCGAELLEEEEDDLVADDEEEEEDEEVGKDDDELIEIYSGPPYASNLVANALKERGITAAIRPDIDSTIMPPTEAGVFITESDYHNNEDVVEECLEMVESEADQGALFGADEE